MTRDGRAPRCGAILLAALTAVPGLAAAGGPLAVQAAPDTVPERGESLFDHAGEALLRRMLGVMAPAFAELARELGDLSGYEPPERLPNGDILIRRKPDLPPAPRPEAPREDLAPGGGEAVDL